MSWTHRRDDVDVVVVGFDRGADYTKLKDASVLVERGVPLIASNADRLLPRPGGESWPGAGALLAAIETTTGRDGGGRSASRSRPLFELALDSAGGGRPLVVGDRLDTDIAGAARLGWDSALVLTGADPARGRGPSRTGSRRSSSTASPTWSERRRRQGPGYPAGVTS